MTAAMGSAVKATSPSGLTVKVPSRWMCERILEAAKVPTASIAHSQMVEELSSAIVKAIDARFPGRVDARLVTAGALLHELGAGWRKDMGYIMAGVGLAHRLGLDPRLIEIIRRHKGAGMGYQEAARIGLPLSDLVPRTVEELIVSHADLLVQGDRRLRIEEVVENFVKAGHLEAADRISKVHYRLSLAADEDIDRLGPYNGMYVVEKLLPRFGMDHGQGKLLAVEDPKTFERKRGYISTRNGYLSAMMFVTAGVGFLAMMWLAYIGEEALAFLTSIFLLFWPLAIFSTAGPFNSSGDYQQGPVRIYVNGVAVQGPQMKYHFLPWTDIESYRWKEKGSLGRVLTLGRGAFSCFLLPSMREFDLVYPVILKNLTLVGN